MTTDYTDFPEGLRNVLEQLESMKTIVHGLAIDLLMEGELKPPSPNTPEWERYPYDYDFYVENSMDPNVQALSTLENKVEETISLIKERFTQ